MTAQTVVKGKVTDQQTGKALPFVSIAIPGQANGDLTDEKGEFQFQSDNPISTLIIAHMGYIRQTIPVKPGDKYLHIALTADNLTLAEVAVTGFSSARKLIETAGSISYLNAKAIRRASNVSLSQSLNTLPGVRMEENGFGGSTRLSIRGSQLRAPWGIRNVKVYWNDLPLSDPSGYTSAFTAIDVSAVGSIEVLKGPSGSIYGAGTGGVISLSGMRNAYGEKNVELSNTIGSFGLRRTLLTARAGNATSNLTVSFTDQALDGYRQHNTVGKRALNLMADFHPNERQTIALFAFHNDGSIDLPGALTEAEAAQAPKQAIPFAIEGDTRVSNKTTMIGASQRYALGEKWTNNMGVYLISNHLDHPWGSGAAYNGYSIGNSLGYGARTRFTYMATLGNIKTTVNFGAETQFSNEVEKEYLNAGGKTGALRADYELVAGQSLFFAQADFDLPAAFILTLGGSYNLTRYNFINRADLDSPNPRLITNFDPTFAPRIGLVKRLGEQTAIHASIGYGFSPPTTAEVQTQAGINRTLHPESGINYELGMRGTAFKSKLNFDIATFLFNLSDAILPRVNEAQQTFFENTGATQQLGVEAMLSYLLINDDRKTISLLKPWVSYTFSHFRFTDYQTATYDWATSGVVIQDYGDNSIPGIAPAVIVAGIDLESRLGLYLMTTVNHVGSMYVTNDNTEEVPAYTLLGAKAGWKKVFNGRYGLEVFGGTDNALNADYNIFLTINGTNGRYYNPGPAANYYSGVSLKYLFK